MKYIIIFSLMLMTLVSCEEDLSQNTIDTAIIGDWVYLESSDTLSHLTKVKKIPGNEYSISFNSDGSLLEIKNAGWCGTPPIAYEEVEGSWEFKDDSTLSFNSIFWGGDIYMEWQILEMNSQQMTYFIKVNEAVYKEEK